MGVREFFAARSGDRVALPFAAASSSSTAIAPAERAADYVISLNDWLEQVSFNGNGYTLGIGAQGTSGTEEPITGTFEQICQRAYRQNGPIFACILARSLLFSEARVQWRNMRGGKTGELFGNADLAPFESPAGPSSTTRNLLTRAEQDVSLAGNYFLARRPIVKGPNRGQVRLRRMRPDWVTIVYGSLEDPALDLEIGDLDAEVIGYVYEPGGPNDDRPAQFLPAGEVGHWAPIPDPTAFGRGMSWISTVLDEVQADNAATRHKLNYFNNGATPGIGVVFPKEVTPERFAKWTELFENEHVGVQNAWKALYMGGGADLKVLGANLRELSFKETQGGGETRIAAAAGVPPIIAGFSEGLESATYSNYGQARRRFADLTIRPNWGSWVGAMQHLTTVPAGAELWYDERGIAFLRDDSSDAATIQQARATTITSLVREGFEPDSVVAAVEADDFTLLKHSGLPSVQVQPTPAPNGNGSQPMPMMDPNAADAAARGLELARRVTRGG